MIAIRFALGAMLPSRCQLLINGPKVRCSRSQLCIRTEDRANAKAAISRKGVVGNSGNTRPTPPMATEVRPASSQRNLIPASTLAVHHNRAGSDKPVSVSSELASFLEPDQPLTQLLHFVEQVQNQGGTRRVQPQIP